MTVHFRSNLHANAVYKYASGSHEDTDNAFETRMPVRQAVIHKSGQTKQSYDENREIFDSGVFYRVAFNVKDVSCNRYGYYGDYWKFIEDVYKECAETETDIEVH